MTQRWSVTAVRVTNTVQAPWIHKHYPKIMCYMDDQQKAMAKALISLMHLCLLGDTSWRIKPSNLPFEVGFQLNNTCLAERAWCSVGSTGGKASRVCKDWEGWSDFHLWPAVKDLHAGQQDGHWFCFLQNQLMTLGTSLGTDPSNSGFSPGFWFSSAWHHSHAATSE